MITKQKKKAEIEKSMVENRQKTIWKNILAELGLILLTAAGICTHGFWYHTGFAVMLRNIVMMALGFAIVGFLLRQEYLNQSLLYNNGRHLFRFWSATVVGLAIAFSCVFLPAGAWPFLTIFVMLSLYSNLSIGILASSVLLMLPILLGEAHPGIFFLYFVSGIFAASLFQKLEGELKIGIPWILSMLCFLVCETANIVLLANERLSMELFVVPVVNLIISGILLTGFLNYFSGSVIYQYREQYLELNDTENTILTEYKKSDREAYFLCIHTAYFCERIAGRLKLDGDALKCAGYYHKLYGKLVHTENAPAFPPAAEVILQEYQDRKVAVTHKETVVLICSDIVVSTIMLLLSKNEKNKLDYNQIIDAVFKKFQENGSFQNCNIEMQELSTMQKIFKEEKLYYDFLR